MLFEGFESLGADDMLDPAGIRLGYVLRYAPGDEKLRHEAVPFIYGLGDPAAFFREAYVAGVGYAYEFALTQVLHTYGYTGFLEAHLVCYVNAPDHRQPAAQYEYGL